MLPTKSASGLILAAYIGLSAVPVPSKDIRIKLDSSTEIVLEGSIPNSGDFNYYICRKNAFYDLACKTDLVGNFTGSTNIAREICPSDDPLYRGTMVAPSYTPKFAATECKKELGNLLGHYQTNNK